MSDLNVTTMVGRLTRDPEVRIGPSGTPVANFTLASNHRYTTKDMQQREETAFLACIVFGAPAKWAAEHRKGEPVLVSGRLRTDEWEHEGRSYNRMVLVVDTINFMQRSNGVAEQAVGANGASGSKSGVPF